MAQVDSAIIGFDRYGHQIAALVPVEAVLMIAGLGAEVSPRKREAIIEAAQLFAENMPGRRRAAAPRQQEKPARKAKAPAPKKKVAKKKKKTVGKGV